VQAKRDPESAKPQGDGKARMCLPEETGERGGVSKSRCSALLAADSGLKRNETAPDWNGIWPDRSDLKASGGPLIGL